MLTKSRVYKDLISSSKKDTMSIRRLLFILALCISVVATILNFAYLNGIQDDSGPPLLDPLNEKLPVVKMTKYDDTTQHNRDGKLSEVAGLNCDRYGGPSEEEAAEMVYWRDIPSDSEFESPFAKAGPDPKYLTFEPDEGGWNNIRMSMETAVTMAHAMGRILVLPPRQGMYLLNKDQEKDNNKFTFKDFFPFDYIQSEHPAVQIISFEEFLEREAMTGHLKDKKTGKVSFPPKNKTNWDSDKKPRGSPLWQWMRTVATNPKWFFDDCLVAFPKDSSPGGDQRMYDYFNATQDGLSLRKRLLSYYDNPTPVDASPKDRLRELLGHREGLCVYDERRQDAKVFHLMGDNDSGARLLVHFYLFLFFEDWKQDLWTKRFVRDHLRYLDEIQCAAARVVAAMRQKARENGDPNGNFDTFHIRRGDFQYKSTRVSADEIYENTRDVFQENSTIFIATDERALDFFEPLRKHYHIYFLKDFQHLLKGLNKNYFGMLDQRIASRGRVFAGAFFSTFTGYINRCVLL